MKRALLVLVLAAAVGAAVAVAAPGRAFGECAYVVVWHDRAYVQYWSFAAAPHADPGPSLRGAVEPGCNDTGGDVPSPSSVGARAIRGVGTDVAILSQGGILIAPGYFPQVGGFPLVRPGAPVEDETRNCRLGAPLTLSGRALPDTGRLNLGDVRSSRPVRLSGHEFIDLVVDGRTQLEALTYNGIPYVGNGQAVRIEGQFCRVPGSVGPVVIARRITRAGPLVPQSTAEDILGAHWRGSAGVAADGGGPRRVVAAVAVLAVALGGWLLVRGRRSRSPASGAG
jgi:hypothetical protein